MIQYRLKRFSDTPENIMTGTGGIIALGSLGKLGYDAGKYYKENKKNIKDLGYYKELQEKTKKELEELDDRIKNLDQISKTADKKLARKIAGDAKKLVEKKKKSLIKNPEDKKFVSDHILKFTEEDLWRKNKKSIALAGTGLGVIGTSEYLRHKKRNDTIQN